jgi:hypothetical protein
MSVDFRSVRKILWEDWDPIGCGVPPDEYDDYAPQVIRLLLEGESRAAVVDYLRFTAAETIQCPVSEEKLALVADKLMALKESPE